MVPHIFGDFIPPPEKQSEYLQIGFSPSSIPLKQRWRNNGLSADFLADYLSSFYPIDETDAALQYHQDLRASVSHIANELMENAMKYSHEFSGQSILLELHLHPDALSIYVTNGVSPDGLARFQSFIQRLLNDDPQVLYLQLIEASSLDASLETSGLGLLSIMDDYQADLGWKFSALDDDKIQVTTMARLPVAVPH